VTPPSGCAFYSVADSRHFIGAVALLNSLRLMGHEEPMFLVDAGLTPEQRSLLAGHVTLVRAPDGVPAVLATPLAPMEHPADVAVILDADVIATRALTELIDTAREGRIVGFVNNEPNHDRYFDSWSATLGLGPLRRQPYLNAGQLVVPGALASRLLPLWKEGLSKVDLRRTWVAKGKLSDPFYFGDQDVINAIMAATFEPDEIAVLEHRLAPHPPFAGLGLVDAERLLCRYPSGESPFLLHHVMGKPWLRATRTNVYTRLLPRLLLAPDVAIRLPPHSVPLRLREGRLASADRRRADAQAFVRDSARRQLGRFGIRTALSDWRRRRARRSVTEAR
jgi:hypothetical protein